MHDPTDPPPNDAHRALPASDQAQEGDRAPASLDLIDAVTDLRTDQPITVDRDLIAAYQAASSPHSIRALKSDLEAFDAWCRRNQRIALPATPEVVADYLDARAGQGGKPASLARYRASIARIHQLLDLKDPTAAPLVKLRLAAVRREKGSAQTQARPLRFKGPVRDVEGDKARGLNIRALLESCPDDLPGLRDRALLSTAYDTGLRASELVAAAAEHVMEAIDPEARLLKIPRHKGDPEGEGATAFLSPRTVAAIAAWTEAAGIGAGPLFRRVQVRRYKARAAVRGRRIDSISSRETWDLRKTLSRPAQPARVEYDIGTTALHPGSIGPIFRAIIQRAFDGGALPDLTAEDLARLLGGISVHSTRIGLNQDLFAVGEDLAGIMGALRWKSPRMLNSFLQFLEESNATDSVVVAATNHPELLDRALVRRFDEIIEYGLPDASGVRAMIGNRLGRMAGRSIDWASIPLCRMD